MDIGNIKEAQTADYELLHPVDRRPLGITFTLAGPQHPIRRGQQAQYARQLRNRVNRTGRLTLDDPDIEEERETAYLVACTLGWKNLDLNGVSYPHTAENARALYENHDYAWLRAQIQDALKVTENFIANSAPVSSLTPSNASA